MATLGILSSATLAALIWRGPGPRPSRWWLYFLLGTGMLYGAELAYGIALLGDQHNRSAVSALAGITLGLFAIGLARAWQLLGGRGHRLIDAFWFVTRTHPDREDDLPHPTTPDASK